MASIRNIPAPVRALRDRVDWSDESGAQAAEYAMLGGVSAAACGGLVEILTEPDVLNIIVEAVLDAMGGFVSSWF